MIIKTERLEIRLATDEEMRALTEGETDAEMKKAYGEMLEGCLREPEKRLWYAVWFVEADGETVGDLCFKGLTADGVTEIGYGILPEHWGKGYATEAVKGVTRWAKGQPGVKRVEAETAPDNEASRRVLEKAGFQPTGENGEEGPRFVLNG